MTVAEPPKQSRLRSMIGWSVSGQVIYVLSQFGILALLTRFASVEDVGRFGLASAIATPIFFFFNLGLRYNQATDVSDSFGFRDFLALRSATSLVGLAVIAALSILSVSDPRTFWILALFSLAKAVETLSDLMYGVFQKHDRLKLMALSIIARGILSVVAFAIILLTGGGVITAFSSLFLCWLAVFLAFDLPMAARLAGRQSAHASLAEMARLARTSVPLGVEGLFANLGSALPRLILGGLTGLETLGYFTAVAYIYQAGVVIVQALNQAVLGRLARYWQEGQVAPFRSVLTRLSLTFSALALTLALVLVPVREDVLTLAFGAEYGPYGWLLVLMISAMALSIPFSVHQTGLIAQRRFAAQALNRAIYAGLVGLGCVIAIPLYGVNGAAVGMAMAALVQLPITLLLLSRSRFPPKALK